MRVVVVGPLSTWMVNFRGEMLRAIVAAGHEALAVAPEDDPEVRTSFSRMGVAFAPYPLQRAGLNPFRDLRTVRHLRHLFREFRADVVLCYAAKPVIYGMLAGRLAGVPLRAAMITGIGSVLQASEGFRQRTLRAVLRSLYRIALRQAQVVFFQNPDDQRLFQASGLVGPANTLVRINGSGVDLRHYAPAPIPPAPVRFLMVGRLIRDKGLMEYVAAARQARSTIPEARFQLLGPLDTNPTAISREELDSWQAEGAIEYLGSTGDVRPFLAAAHVCVLPSYGEGTPRSVLEAMAMARPVIVTDVPGCRETVEPGGNGLMVPVRDSRALARAMETLAGDRGTLEAMARRSRAIAEERFDVHSVNRVILGELGLLR